MQARGARVQTELECRLESIFAGLVHGLALKGLSPGVRLDTDGPGLEIFDNKSF